MHIFLLLTSRKMVVIPKGSCTGPSAAQEVGFRAAVANRRNRCQIDRNLWEIGLWTLSDLVPRCGNMDDPICVAYVGMDHVHVGDVMPINVGFCTEIRIYFLVLFSGKIWKVLSSISWFWPMAHHLPGWWANLYSSIKHNWGAWCLKKRVRTSSEQSRSQRGVNEMLSTGLAASRSRQSWLLSILSALVFVNYIYFSSNRYSLERVRLKPHVLS